MGILANENSISAGGYTIERSLRFQSASSQYLSRTPASAGNTLTWTFSAWVKRGSLSTGAPITIFAARSGGNSTYITISEKLTIAYNVGGTTQYDLASVAVFRDPAAWYHVVIVSDLTQATSTDRIKMYVNGVLQTYTGTPPTQNYANSYINTTYTHAIGALDASNWYFDGYMTEINFVNAQALTPSSFGETDALTGVWVAKRYTGTYGTNGFYLKFNDGTSTTTLGQDRSGNANNWTLTNFTRSAGVSDCWMYDVPSGNGSGGGTQPSSNYAVLNPVYANTQGIGTISRGNLNFSFGNATTQAAVGTFSATSGKWYWEVIASANPVFVGVRQINTNDRFSNSILWGGSSVSASGDKWVNGTQSAFAGITYTTGDVVGVAVDMDGGNVSFYKNNTLVGTLALSLATITEFVPAFNNGASTAFAGNVNFGNRSFAYTPPSGFKALCTANLPAPTIAKGNQYMDATLYTGNNTGQTITNSGSMQPDLLWIKVRSNTYDHVLADSVRGVSAFLSSNTTTAEGTNSELTSFNSNGFTLGATGSMARNVSGQTYVAWQWDAGSSTVTNTSGTISSQVRANTTAGFSIVTYTGTGANATVGHGLGVAPKMVIVKRRDNGAGGTNWFVWHTGLTSGAFGLFLNTTAAQSSDTTWWNSTIPTSSVFSVGTSVSTNGSSGTFVAYVFAEIAGFSKFGSYTGNGSADGVFIYTGFRPKFFLVKRTDTVESWNIVDTSRDTYNQAGANLYPNLSNAESTNNSCDILSNGIKLRNTWAGANANGGTYIYMAFAENPFNYSNAR